jgi:hypothetical protein
MNNKRKTKKRGRVQKVIKPPHPSLPEKVQIEVEGADDLYKEIRIENTLEDDTGQQLKLKEHAPVDVIIEADPESTTPKNDLKEDELVN